MQKYLLPSLLLIFLSITVSAQVNLNSGLVAYYPFNGNTNDASGNGYNATNFGATLTTDQWGTPNAAYYFDGVSNYMWVPNSANLQPQQITLAARVYPTGFYGGLCYNMVVLDKGDNDFIPGQYSLRSFPTTTTNCSVPDTSFSNFRINFQGGCAVSTMNTTPYIQTNNWYCLVGTYDGSTIKMFVNGVLRFSCAYSGPIGANLNDLFIGRKNHVQYPYWFKGKMDEVRIYNRALNQQEVDSLCNLVATPIQDTTINKYAAVLSRSVCDNSFTVDTATGFNAGDTVLMIQMKGATIDTTNTPFFGRKLAYNGAGNHEFNIIKSVLGNIITLKYKLKRNYDIPFGKVQFVRVANYQNYTVSKPLSSQAWDGNKGGVLMMNVAGTLTLNSNIDVTGKGFRGGQILLSSANTCNKTDYYYPGNTNEGAQKGEGIGQISNAKMYGRGRLANGGGGGNAHNAGGGGGGNGGLGGLGGNQFQQACGTVPVIGGIGGDSLTYSIPTNRIYLGGGGGAGHGNNLGEKPGGNGGGIVFLLANTLISNGYAILANGADAIECTAVVPGCRDDGVGGGGGGGAVVTYINNYTGNVTVSARGGKGANSLIDLTQNTTPIAPGGGGGGGAIWVTQAAFPATTTNNVSGGLSGVATQFSNTNYGSQPGTTGRLLTGFPYTFPTIVDTFKPNIIIPAFTDSVVSCYTRKMINSSTTSATGISSYNWDAGVAGTSTAKNPTFTFPDYGTYSVRLIVIDSNGCQDSLKKNIIIPYNHFANAGHDTISCFGLGVLLHATGGASYSWSPTSTLSSPNSANTIATPLATTSYIVTVTNSAGCIDKDTVLVTLALGTKVVARADTSVCLGKNVPLFASGVVSYQWSPTGGLTNPSIPNPIATFTGDVDYVVTGTDNKGCVSFDTVKLTERPGPVIDAYSIDGNTISCYSQSIHLTAIGGVKYTWNPGIYVNDSTIPSPVVTPPVTTLFTVTGMDLAGCTGKDTISITVLDKAVYMPNAFSPNGDHINDDIRPTLVCDFRLDSWEIYNRWGKVVFSSNNLNKGWDGRYNDEPQPMDVYVYYIKGKNADGKSVAYKGNITLIR